MLNSYLGPQIIQLLKGNNGQDQDSYFAHLIMQMRLRFDDTIPAPAGVYVTNKINLIINRKLWEQQSEEWKVAVLKHEIMHVALFHCTKKSTKDKHMQWNFAQDCHINCEIPLLRQCDNAINPRTLKNICSDYKEEILYDQPSQYYFDIMEQSQKAQEYLALAKIGEGDLGPLDDHDLWDKSEEMSTQKQVIKDALEKAKKTAGKCPNNIEFIITELNKNTIAWKQKLRNLIFKTISQNKINTRKKPNRRYGWLTPAKKKQYTCKLVVVNDTSGSVSDDQIKQFYSEINNIATFIDDIMIINCDAEAGEPFKYKRGMQIKVTGRGGTMYQPGIDKAMELGADVITYFGDMDSADTPKDPKIPFIWARVGKQNPPADFGTIVDVIVD